MRILLAVLAPLLLVAQHAPPPAFDAVAIHPLAGLGNSLNFISISGPNVTMAGMNLSGLVLAAYGLEPYQLDLKAVAREFGNSYWDIRAVAPRDRVWKKDDLRPLLQTMLARRFRVTFHRQARELPAYVLTVEAGGPKFNAGTGDAPCAMQGEPAPAGQRYIFKNCPIRNLAAALGLHLLDRPVVLDHTGLQGNYDLTITAMPDSLRNSPRGQTLDAIDPRRAVETLGLKLEPVTAPVDVLVVDHAAKPTSN